jgi:hypothetical protein
MPRDTVERDSPRCRLCGDRAVFALEAWFGDDAPEETRAPTLCSPCSDTAGDWYAPEFKKWCRLAKEVVGAGPADALLDADPRATWTPAEFANVRPARFLKQLMTMLIAIAPPGFGWGEHPELAGFAQAPGRRGLPSRYQAYLSLYRGPLSRFVGYSAQLDARSGRPTELLEFAYPPFSCVLSLSGETAIETTNISEFAELGIDDRCVVDLDLLNGFGHTPFPADFRTRAAVERDREADRRAA